MNTKPIDNDLSEFLSNEAYVHIKRLKLDDGSFANPAVYFDDDPDNGIYRSNDNELTVTKNMIVNGDFTTDNITMNGVLDLTGSTGQLLRLSNSSQDVFVFEGNGDFTQYNFATGTPLVTISYLSGNIATPGNVTASGSVIVNTISEKTAATGVTIDGVLLKDSQVSTDVINEKSAATGVTIDGVLLKDSQVSTDVINEKSAATGVTIDGVLLKDSQVSTDVINEKSAATGVTIDGVLLKDSQVDTTTINEKTAGGGLTLSTTGTLTLPKTITIGNTSSSNVVNMVATSSASNTLKLTNESPRASVIQFTQSNNANVSASLGRHYLAGGSTQEFGYRFTSSGESITGNAQSGATLKFWIRDDTGGVGIANGWFNNTNHRFRVRDDTGVRFDNTAGTELFRVTEAAGVQCTPLLTCLAGASVTGNVDSSTVSTDSITLATTGGTATALDYYETWSSGSITVSQSNPAVGFFFSTSYTIDVDVVRCGSVVTLSWSSVTQATILGASPAYVYAAVPSRFLPAEQKSQLCRHKSNGSYVTGLTLFAVSDGSLKFYSSVSGGNFTTSAEIAAGSFSWIV